MKDSCMERLLEGEDKRCELASQQLASSGTSVFSFISPPPPSSDGASNRMSYTHMSAKHLYQQKTDILTKAKETPC